MKVTNWMNLDAHSTSFYPFGNMAKLLWRCWTHIDGQTLIDEAGHLEALQGIFRSRSSIQWLMWQFTATIILLSQYIKSSPYISDLGLKKVITLNAFEPKTDWLMSETRCLSRCIEVMCLFIQWFLLICFYYKG